MVRVPILTVPPAPEVKTTLASQEALQLWHERVRLLDALVAVQSTRETYVGL